ncbi:MAG: YdbL family protein [Pseudomonadota bacterium]
MRRWIALPLTAVALTACVTINVYFPAAEAREAAREFVEKVISEDDAAPSGGDTPRGQSAAAPISPAGRMAAMLARVDVAALLGIGAAQAQGQPDINIRTPAIQAIQARMEQRFDAQLRAGFDAGALGFTSDGLVVVRDAAKLPLKDRVAINQAVADDNRDRKAVYREIAVANGHPEWEPRIREVFAQQWVASARPGWWYQSGGAWKQK